MWPFNKNHKEKEKGIIIPSGGRLQIPLPPVRFDRGKCFVLIDGGERLIDEEGFIAEIGVDDARPIRIKIFPDFKNRRLSAVEIIDVNDNKKYPKDGPQLKFVGLGPLNRDDIRQHIDNMQKYIDELNEDILKANKRIRRNSYAAIAILLIIASLQLYWAYVQTGISRYIDIGLIIISIGCIYINIWYIKKANKIDRYIELEKSGKSDGHIKNDGIEIVKEK